MKRNIKTILIIFFIVIFTIFLDSARALTFNDSPLIKVRKYYNDGELYYKDSGLLVDTFCGINGKKDTVIKGFSYSISDDSFDERIKGNN